MKASINKIESMGLVDGPGIRTVIFFNGCRLRCLFCHNPETWCRGEDNYTTEELMNKILRNKPYFKNGGGITFSGGEPLLHADFLIDICKKLKAENIHIALDTSGVGIGKYTEILELVDLVLLDIKATDKNKYFKLTGHSIDDAKEFITYLNASGKDVWIRQVIIPGFNDNLGYMHDLANMIKTIKNVKKIELLPYHNMAIKKYDDLGITYPLRGVEAMDKAKCLELQDYLIDILKGKDDN